MEAWKQTFLELSEIGTNFIASDGTEVFYVEVDEEE
jgi:hypothetical protein